MNQREIIEALEAYRPGSDEWGGAEAADLEAALQQDPGLRERYDRIRRWDQALGDAVRSGPVPEGLCDRLFAALLPGEAASAADSPPLLPPLPVSPIAADNELLASLPGSSIDVPRRSRFSRAWLAAPLLVAALVLVALLLDPFATRSPQLTTDFANEVIDWTQVLSQTDWQADFRTSELRGAPFDASVRAVPRRWARIQTRYAPRTFVYELTSQRNARAYLFCFSARRSSLPASPPSAPFSTTGGYCIGAWQRDGLVYVLAVQGSERRYRGMIQSAIILGEIEESPLDFLLASI